jgi:hypothetical protein
MPTAVVTTSVSKIPSLLHPSYRQNYNDWRKWRLTYEGGDRFIDNYLVRFSNREDHLEFAERKALAYCPAFAKAAITQIRNAIYKRSNDISREGGTKSYQDAVQGKQNGVDLLGSNMSYFMNVKILDELLPMGCVGIFIDMPREVGSTLLEKKGKRPYVYMYQVEDIRSWTKDERANPNEFSSILLCDHNYEYDDYTGLPTSEVESYRYLYLEPTDAGPRVFCEIFDRKGHLTDEFQLGNLDKIPFVLLDISTSLLADAANYQIAHLNLASGDIWFSARANFPFYIEPFDPKSQSPYIKDDFDSDNPDNINGNNNDSLNEVVVGPTRGRRYPLGTNQPAFIHPSAEPLKASMEKQNQMKEEVKQLVNLTLSALTSSEGSKRVDQEGLQNGLAYLGQILQHAEERIGYYWALYEGKPSFPEVQYPEQYELVDPSQIDREIETLAKLIDRTTSLTLKKRCMKIIAELKVSSYVNRDEMSRIFSEIDSADVIVADVNSIKLDLEAGLVSLDLASTARGYPKGEVEKAKTDHAERLARIQMAQTPAPSSAAPAAQARGLPDLSGDPKEGQKEKAAIRDQTKESTPIDPTRGRAINV